MRAFNRKIHPISLLKKPWNYSTGQRITAKWTAITYSGKNYRPGGPADGNRAIQGWTYTYCAPVALNLFEVGTFLENQGWTVTVSADHIWIDDEHIDLLKAFLEECDYSGITSAPLRTDLCAAVQEQGLCVSGC